VSLVYVLAAGVVLGTNFMYQKLESHQKDRIDVLLGKRTDLKGVGYNVNQAKIAIGSGGFLEKGIYREHKQSMILFLNRKPILFFVRLERSGVFRKHFGHLFAISSYFKSCFFWQNGSDLPSVEFMDMVLLVFCSFISQLILA